MATATEPKNGNGGAVATQPKQSLIATMAAKQGLEPTAFFEAVKATVFDAKGTKEELIAFLTVANKYDLNPFTKEIYAFPKKGGGIQPIVSVDGWSNIINSHPEFNGMTFEDRVGEGGEILSITCSMHRKDRAHPIECTEYMAECKGTSEPWRRWPRRMLRHKAMMQAARYAFGLAGIMDPDEAERAESVDWSKTDNSKVGISNVNKLLDSMPAHKPAETHDEGTDDIPADEESQESSSVLESLSEALAACKSKSEVTQVAKRFMVPGLGEKEVMGIQEACDLRSDELPLHEPKGKQTQRNLTE